jgi:hypothetical protein
MKLPTAFGKCYFTAASLTPDLRLLPEDAHLETKHSGEEPESNHPVTTPPRLSGLRMGQNKRASASD